jgi:hypothetical protein
MRNTGLIVEHKTKDWVFLGSNSKLDNQIILEDGDWTKYKTSNEKQFNNLFDTWNCVAFSACNVIEIYFKYLIDNHKISNRNLLWLQENGYIINGEVNFSDRFVGAKAGTKVGQGNTGSRVANAIYEYGLVPEKLYGFTAGMDEKEYYKKVPSEISALGSDFLDRFSINFEVVYASDIENALKYSPVQLYVYAWKKNKSGLYHNPNKKFNHATTRIRSNTKQIFDHYDPFIKSLTTSYEYFPTGYKYTVAEVITHMNVEEFTKANDLLFVRNAKTGQFGRIMQGKLKIVETTDRGTLLLLDDAVRQNGRTLTENEWDTLPKENF